MIYLNIIFIAVTIILCTTPVYGARILGLFVYPGQSHFVVIRAIMTELARRGHEVTVISNFRIDEKIHNYKELVIEPTFDYWEDAMTYLGINEKLDMKDFSTPQIYDLMNRIGYATTDNALQNHHLQNLINNQNTTFDLLIVEQFYQDSLLIFGHLYNVPVVAICTGSFENHMSTMTGVIVPWAHSPQDYLPYSDRMSFTQRFWNSLCSLYSEYNRKYIYFPQQNYLVKKYFSHLKEDLPSVAELEKNISVLLVNNFVPVDIPRPYSISMVSVGGVHIASPKTLPRDIRGFLDDARKGAIYFSLGTNYKSSDIPRQQLSAFLKVFSKLRERVLWKWDMDDEVPKLPPNVMAIKRWVPQNDILAHPHVKLFITHGGLLALQEAVYRSVPILGIPIFGDQYVNVRKAVDLNIGVMMDFSNITEVSLTWALQQLLYNPSFMINMRKVTQIFRDRPFGALETSLYWIEYVIRYEGAAHIKSAAVDIPWYSLYLIDVLLVLFIGIFIVISVLYAIFRLTLITVSKRTNRNKLYSKLN